MNYVGEPVEMHLTQIDLNLFVVLDVIHTEGSLTRAGEKLHLSQPAVSHALQRLREIFKDELFVRRGSRMVPTPFTLSIIAHVRVALHSLEGSLHHSRFDPATADKHFQIAMRDLLEVTLLRELIDRVGSCAPQVGISSVRIDRTHLEDDLISGAADLAIDIPLPVGQDIMQKQLGSEGIVVAARHGHSAIAGKLSLKTYLAADHILVSSRRKGLGFEDLLLQRKGHVRNIRLRCQDYFAASQIVSRTDLLLTMPEHCACAINRSFKNSIFIFPLPNASHMQFNMYWHASLNTDAANKWIRRILETGFRNIFSHSSDLALERQDLTDCEDSTVL
jgi:DNA-binding transcriptional LysR family regulator